MFNPLVLCVGALALATATPISPRLAKRQAPTRYSELIVFGDSYSDNAHFRPTLLVTGNSVVVNNRTVVTPPATTANVANASISDAVRDNFLVANALATDLATEDAVTAFTIPYWQGRATNGYVWDEYLSAAMNVSLVNYAYTGSYILNDPIRPTTVLDITQAVDLFLSDRAGGADTAGARTGKSLIAIFIGLNTADLLWAESTALLPHSSLYATAMDTFDLVGGNVTLLSNSIAKLAASTTLFDEPPDFLILPIPPLNTIFNNIAVVGGNEVLLALANVTSTNFNARIKTLVTALGSTLPAGQRVLTFDLPTWWTALYTNPTQHGLVTSSGPCANLFTKTVAPSCAGFFSIDGLHPTTQVHQMLAQQLLPIVSG